MTETTSNAPILTVTQLTNAIKLSLEATFPSVWLQGEVSNCKLQSSGHLYFCLKDAQAQISAVMFRGDLTSVKPLPKDGSHVIIRGELNVYPPSGKYQLIVRELRHAGLGELLLKLEELKMKLHKKGWFKKEHKKPLPKFPKRIGVVTSPTGAVIQDILNILTRRAGGFHLILNPVKVQGEGAAQEIAQAIAQFNHHNLADVLIVGRGGGSIEDLWAFNEEIVAEAIFNSRIPIISAVGHETDHCIADYVADVRAPTPSAAAEIVIADKLHQLNHLEQIRHRLKQTISHSIKHHRQCLDGFRKHPLLSSPYSLLGPWFQKIDGYRSDLDEIIKHSVAHKHLLLDSRGKQVQALRPSAQIIHFKHKLQHWDKALYSVLLMRLQNSRKLLQQKKERFDQTMKAKFETRKRVFDPLIKQRQLDQTWDRIIGLRRERLEKITAALHAVNPKNVLTKGYCILFAEKDRSVITSIGEIKQQQDIRILLTDGEILSTVKEVFPIEYSTK